jgi:hypothetical protein
MVTQHEIILKAVQLIKSNAQFGLSGDNIDDIVWEDGETPISKTDIEAKLSEAETALENEAQSKIDLKASAKAKLIAGEALTEDEANTIVL